MRAALRTYRLLLPILALALLPAVPAAAEEKAPSKREQAEALLEQAEGLYAEGAYEECRDFLETAIARAERGEVYLTRPVLARLYLLEALIVYAFRVEGEEYREQITDLLHRAVATDLNLDIEDPARYPPSILELFRTTQREYLAPYSRESRRFSVGILGALVIDPTVLSDPSLLQPGLLFSYNLTEALSVVSSLRLPLSLPLWASVRGQIGLAWYPSFRVEKLSTSLVSSYVFSLDDLSTYTHSFSLAGAGEYVFRSGFGFAARAELLRVDLILGRAESGDLPGYRSISLLGESFLRATFANSSIYFFYTF
jgi:hypothetical protein